MGKGTILTQGEINKLCKELNKTPEQIGKELIEYFKNNPTTGLNDIITQNNKRKIANSFATQALLGISDIRPLISAFGKHQRFFYDKNKLWWLWDNLNTCYVEIDETDLLISFDNVTGASSLSISTKTKHEIIEGLKRWGRAHIPPPAPIHWVQFKHKAYSIRSGNTYDVTPDYFFTNPIPWTIGQDNKTPTLDKLFNEWVGTTNTQTLYELLAYCCYTSYPIQRVFCLWGSGRNGKSQFLKILDKFLGLENTTSTELDQLLGSRFESFKLYRKLACIIGETNFGVMHHTSLIKKLTGGDKIGFEKKNKNPFDDYNYSKLIIASNSLPSSQDTSDGFYRRWHIIDFPNEFEETGQEVWLQVPEIEYHALAKKVTEILPVLLRNGKFSGQGSIKARRLKYLSVSNPISLFLKEKCILGEGNYENYNKLYTEYVTYLRQNKRRRVKTTEFKTALEDEGLYVEKTSKRVGDAWLSGRWVEGVRLSAVCDNFPSIPTQLPIYSNKLGKLSQKAEIEQEYLIDNSPKAQILEFILTQQKTTYNTIRTHFPDLDNHIDIINKLLSEGLIFSPNTDVYTTTR